MFPITKDKHNSDVIFTDACRRNSALFIFLKNNDNIPYNRHKYTFTYESLKEEFESNDFFLLHDRLFCDIVFANIKNVQEQGSNYQVPLYNIKHVGYGIIINNTMLIKKYM